MSSKSLITADQAQKSAFDHVLHQKSAKSQGGLSAMMSKDSAANLAASKDYFQHWDNKRAEDETDAIRQSRTDDYASLTRQ